MSLIQKIMSHDKKIKLSETPFIFMRDYLLLIFINKENVSVENLGNIQ